jgi:hypothetical protein
MLYCNVYWGESFFNENNDNYLQFYTDLRYY